MIPITFDTECISMQKIEMFEAVITSANGSKQRAYFKRVF